MNKNQEAALQRQFKKSDFDDDVLSMQRIRRRILNASENSGAHVASAYAALLIFYQRSSFLVLKAELFKPLLEGKFKKSDFDDDVLSMQRIRRRILNASENSGAHVASAYAALLIFYQRSSFLVLKAELFKPLLEGKFKKSDFDDDAVSLQHSRRRSLNASEQIMLPTYVFCKNIEGAHVAICLRCAPRFLVSSKLLDVVLKKATAEEQSIRKTKCVAFNIVMQPKKLK